MLKHRLAGGDGKMRKTINLNTDWLFHLGDDSAADYMGYDDGAWRRVTLPHDWVVEHPFDKAHSSGTGYLPGGTAWYRRHFDLENTAGKTVRITFGGVYKHARVWINSNYLGSRAYGYSTFTFDITPFVKEGENVISVRVEHEETADSRWFTGSGIYRDVDLTVTDAAAFVQDGVFAYTKAVENGTAQIIVQYETNGADGAEFSLIAPDGSVAAKAQGAKGEAALQVENALLWSPDSPNLYTLCANAVKDGAQCDGHDIPFGIRTFRFDGDKGFFLNGENMKLKGVCVHHDAGALGAAVPKDVWRRRLEKFKAMGCNAIRTAHNPPDKHLLDLCDEMGFLVMDEAFDEWEGAKNKWWQGHNVYPPKRFGYAEDFPLWHKADLEAMVLRDRNHPSIVIWSIGNEIDYPNDPYVTPLFDEVLGNNDKNKPAAERRYDPRKPDAGRLAVVAQELTDIVHACDPTRPVTSALSFPELSNRTGYADVLDIVGYNYKEKFYEEDHAKYPGRVIYGSENGKDMQAWRAVRDNDYICGQFLWTGVDFLGECHGWPVRISQAGVIDLAGYEKTLYYQRKAMWTDEKFVKIAVGDMDERWMGESECFIWSGNEGEERRVSCYTGEKEAELFLNGVSLGKKQISDEDGYRATWIVPYQPGELRAVAGGAEDSLASHGKAEKICLQADKCALSADGQSVAQVEVRLADANGNTVGADEEIFWQITGDAQIIGIENGRPDDLTPYSSMSRNTFRGRAIVYIRAGHMPCDVTLHGFTRTGLCAQIGFKQA